MKPDYQIAMLWVEGPLSFLEQLCIQSFLDAGHVVILYHYGKVQNVPDGVILDDGRSILDADMFISHSRTGSMALFSDVFRYHLLNRLDRVIWADTDAYCLRPFDSETGHFYGWESAHYINGGVLALPKDSEALAGLLEMTEDEYSIPFWYPDQLKAEFQERADSGKPVHVSEMRWGVWGPHAVTAHLRKSGESKYAFPTEVLYPVPFQRRRMIVKGHTKARAERFITENTRSIHLYGRRMRPFLASRPEGLPDEESLFHQLLQKHKIDPREAPIPAAKPTLGSSDT